MLRCNIDVTVGLANCAIGTVIDIYATRHTKFSPDLCFGLIKRPFRRTEVGHLEDIASVVNDFSHMNVSQMVAKEVIVPSYDWKSFLAPCFYDIKGIHHFTFEEQSLRGGDLITQLSCNDQPQAVRILRDTNFSPPTCVPPIIPPKVLSAERQWYLFEKI
uniref:Uncharacterized protein n=1 Tax=Amphimedon queenslandica TaxID=400682 RepID=A0A1X7VDE6_AMPQE